MPLTQNPPAPAAPTTIDEAKAQGLAVTGTQFMAPLASSSGAIDHPSGSLVVTVVKGFWESPTIKAIWHVVAGAVGLAILGVAGQIMAASGDITAMNWQTTEKIFIGTLAFALASAYAAWWKTKDNDPVKQGGGATP
jgi:hypothetical protein